MVFLRIAARCLNVCINSNMINLIVCHSVSQYCIVWDTDSIIKLVTNKLICHSVWRSASTYSMIWKCILGSEARWRWHIWFAFWSGDPHQVVTAQTALQWVWSHHCKRRTLLVVSQPLLGHQALVTCGYV